MAAKYFVKEPSEEHLLLRQQNDLLQQLLLEQRNMTLELLKELRAQRAALPQQIVVQSLPIASVANTKSDVVDDYDFDVPDDEIFIPKANLNSEVSLKSVESTSTDEIPQEELAKLRKHKENRR